MRIKRGLNVHGRNAAACFGHRFFFFGLDGETQRWLCSVCAQRHIVCADFCVEEGTETYMPLLSKVYVLKSIAQLRTGYEKLLFRISCSFDSVAFSFFCWAALWLCFWVVVVVANVCDPSEGTGHVHFPSSNGFDSETWSARCASVSP
jgi:hypothetical protein